jgi:hypothetical protein
MSGSRTPPRAFPYWSRSTRLKIGVVAISFPPPPGNEAANRVTAALAA